MRILFLDDMKTRHNSFCKLNFPGEPEVEHTGAHVCAAGNTMVHHAFTMQEAISELKAWRFDAIYLDHDLGWEQPKDFDHQANNGMKVVDWMVTNQNNQKAIVYVHSMNIIRGPEMVLRLLDADYTAHLLSFAKIMGATLLDSGEVDV